MACGILAHKPGVRLQPVVGALSLNHWTNREPQTPGNIHWSEASQGPHLDTKTQLYLTVYRLQCWKPQAKQPVSRENNATH